ncbi:hypothetical protein Q5O24_10085 [Eubacteriaceae bacterium ES3]|nr:hypothetical protein Q5O24_10085 [Eubacteriaceae bacterium ES3]
MKKRIGLSLIVLLAFGLLTGCASDSSTETTDLAVDGISFTAEIDEVSDTELLVTVLDDENYDQARINLDGLEGLDFEPEVGQTIAVTVKNQMGMSMPPFMNPISIELKK